MFKKFTLSTVLAFLFFGAMAQQDSTKYDPKLNDTMKIGRILIIKMNRPGEKDSTDVSVKKSKWKEGSRFSTSWLVLDLGFSNFSDKTNYANTGDFLVNRPGTPVLGKEDFEPRIGRSRNVNIWFVMQEFSLIKRNVNLKYGLGLELNNYHFKSDISFRENGTKPYGGGMTNAPFVFRDSVSFSKNKLAADYLTVPLMLNFSTNNGLYISGGVSGGYLYSLRNKQRGGGRGIQKSKGDFDAEKFKLSYIGEIGFGGFSVYGSYSPKSMFENEMDIRPFNVGLRLNFL